MHRTKLLQIMNISGEHNLIVTHMDFLMWGQVLVFHMQIVDSDAIFQMIFDDCREVRWKIYTHPYEAKPPAFPDTELIQFLKGQSQHQKPANLLTEHFGLTLTYGKLLVRHEDEEYEIADE